MGLPRKMNSEQDLLSHDRILRVCDYAGRIFVSEYHLLSNHLLKIFVNSLPSELGSVQNPPDPDSDRPSSEIAASFLEYLQDLWNEDLANGLRSGLHIDYLVF